MNQMFHRFADRPLADLVTLRGRTAVVTGAARGIGEAIVRRLSEAGATVHAVDAREPELRRTAEAYGAVPHVLDMTDHAEVRRLADGLAALDI